MSGHLGRTRSVSLTGLVGAIVEVEAHIGPGLPAFVIGGLPDTAIAQSPDRIRAATSGVISAWSDKRVTVNLSPASLPKRGTGFDLPIAVSIMRALGRLPVIAERTCHVGELGLDGSLRAVRGVLPAVLAAARAGIDAVVVPADNAGEAALVEGIEVRPARTLADVREGYEALRVGAPWPVAVRPTGAGGDADPRLDLADVVGQHQGRLALELAAAGGHHLMLNGPPGAGKTMLAERLVTILPPLRHDQAIEVQAIRSLHGDPVAVHALPTRPPFVAPHHSASMTALVGGGTTALRPGEISRAHHGVLFLDEVGEFGPRVLQALRQPIESGRVVIGRALTSVEYPAVFQLVLATNPCPCGQYGAPDSDCACSSLELRRYISRLNGPLTDRVDLQIGVRRVGRAELSGESGESSAVVAARVAQARGAQAERWAASGHRLNGRVPGALLRRPPWRLPAAVTAGADQRLDSGRLTLRGYDRVLRVAWTQADREGRTSPRRDDVDMALAMRQAS